MTEVFHLLVHCTDGHSDTAAEARSQELCLSLPRGFRRTRTWAILATFPGTLASSESVALSDLPEPPPR